MIVLKIRPMGSGQWGQVYFVGILFFSEEGGGG
jgi:hypothetical protein